MKNFVKLAMMSILLICTFAKAQTSKVVGTAPTDYSSEIRMKLATNTAKFKENVSSFYQVGYTYQQFRAGVLGTNNAAATIEGEALLQVVFSFLKDGISSEQIMATYNGKAMAEAMIKTNGVNEVSLFAIPVNQPKLGIPANQTDNKGGCRWWQISCWIDDIFGAGTSGAVIKAALLMIFK